MEIEKLQAAVEAILFTMGDSVELEKIAAAIGHDYETTRKIVHTLMDRCEEEDRGVRIIELENSFQMCTKKEMYEYLIRVAKQPKRYVLTDVLLETLSIIAYRQPVTRLEIPFRLPLQPPVNATERITSPSISISIAVEQVPFVL